MCSCSPTTGCAAACATGSAVCGSASSSVEVLSVRGSPDGPERRTGTHKAPHLPAMIATRRLAPRPSAAPVKMPEEEIRRENQNMWAPARITRQIQII